jgi:hypothetical protein
MGQHIEMGQREWNGLVLRLIRHIGHLEADELAAYGLAEPVGACTRAYLAKDVLAWRQHAHEIQWRLVQLGYRVPWREPHQKLRDASIRVLTGDCGARMGIPGKHSNEKNNRRKSPCLMVTFRHVSQ